MVVVLRVLGVLSGWAHAHGRRVGRVVRVRAAQVHARPVQRVVRLEVRSASTTQK